ILDIPQAAAAPETPCLPEPQASAFHDAGAQALLLRPFADGDGATQTLVDAEQCAVEAALRVLVDAALQRGTEFQAGIADTEYLSAKHLERGGIDAALVGAAAGADVMGRDCRVFQARCHQPEQLLAELDA